MTLGKTMADEFLEVHVLPSLDVWSSQANDIRLAMNAVISLYHMADYFWHAHANTDTHRVFGTPGPGKFRAQLALRNWPFGVIRDVAEAHKHMALDRTPRLLTHSSQTVVGATGFGESGFGTGPYGGGPSIVVQMDDNSKHHLWDLAEEVKRLWITMLL